MNTKSENILKRLDEEFQGSGKYQRWMVFLTCLTVSMCGLSVVNHIFTAFVVPYRCVVPVCENPDNTLYEAAFLNFTTPFDDESEEKRSTCYTFAFEDDDDDDVSCNANSFNSSSVKECSNWVYDKTLFTNTLVSEFDLTCKRSWLQPLASSAYMFGMPAGALIIGELADRIGRRKAIVIAIFLITTCEFIGSFSVNYVMYFIMRFLAGAGSIGAFQLSMIQALEVVPTKKRAFSGMLLKIPFALAEASISGIAYFIRNWRWMQRTASLPTFLLLSFWWIMPESIRWLLSKGKYEEAKIAIKKAADMNKVEISEDMYKDLNMNEKNQEKGNEISNAEKRSAFDLFKSPSLRKKTIVLILTWNIVTHGFYTMSSNSTNFGGSVFTSYLLVMLIEIPSYIFGYFALDILGRKGTMTLLLVSGGVAGLASSLFGEDMSTVLIVLNLAAKFFTSAAISVIYIYTIEIYSTQYRSLGLGLCSMSARIGGIIAPFTAGLVRIYKPLPLIINGILLVFCGFLLLFLPETLGQELPQTLEDSENCGKDQGIFYFACFQKKKNETKNNELPIVDKK